MDFYPQVFLTSYDEMMDNLAKFFPSYVSLTSIVLKYPIQRTVIKAVPPVLLMYCHSRWIFF